MSRDVRAEIVDLRIGVEEQLFSTPVFVTAALRQVMSCRPFFMSAVDPAIVGPPLPPQVLKAITDGVSFLQYEESLTFSLLLCL